LYAPEQNRIDAFSTLASTLMRAKIEESVRFSQRGEWMAKHGEDKTKCTCQTSADPEHKKQG
jgi:hypothetical protein